MTTSERFVRLSLMLAIVAAAALFIGAWYGFTNVRPDYLIAFGGHFYVYLAMPVAFASAAVALLVRSSSRIQIAATVLFVLVTVYVVVDLLRLFAYMLNVSHGL